VLFLAASSASNLDEALKAQLSALLQELALALCMAMHQIKKNAAATTTATNIF
jgi:GTP cyclohydrolase I